MKKICLLFAFIVLSSSAFAQKQAESSSVQFRGYGYAGTAFVKNYGGITTDVNLGIEIVQRVFLGVETGFHTFFVPTDLTLYLPDMGTTPLMAAETYVPIGVNLKAYFTKDRLITPLLNISFGGHVGCLGFKGANGLYCQLGAGFNVKTFSFSVGYLGRQVIDNSICTPSAGYVKVGWRF